MFEKKIQDFSSNVAIDFKNELNVHKNMSTLFLKTGQYVVFWNQMQECFDGQLKLAENNTKIFKIIIR